MKRVLNKKIFLLALGMMIFMGSFHIDKFKILVYPFFREIGHQWILYKIRDYDTFETEHFIIRYPSKDPEVINLVAKSSEKNYQQICNMFQYYPKDKSVIIVYNNSEELMDNANIGKGKPPMGVYFSSTIQILSPRLWVSSEENMEEVFLNEGPMVHEFTHLLVDDLGNGNYPLWFTEGIALYQEYVQTGYRWGEDLVFEEKPYTLKQLTHEFHDLDQILAYKRSFEMMEDFIEDNGFEEINKILKSLGDGNDFSKFENQFSMEKRK